MADDEFIGLLARVEAKIDLLQSSVEVMENMLQRQDAIQRWFFTFLSESNPLFSERLAELKQHTTWFD